MRVSRKKVLVLCGLKEFGKTKWAQQWGPHLMFKGSHNPSMLHDCMEEGDLRYILFDEIKLHVLLFSDFASAVMGGQGWYDWKNKDGDTVRIPLGLPVIVTTNFDPRKHHPSEKMEEKLLEWENSFVWVYVDELLYDESRPVAPLDGVATADAAPSYPSSSSSDTEVVSERVSTVEVVEMVGDGNAMIDSKETDTVSESPSSVPALLSSDEEELLALALNPPATVAPVAAVLPTFSLTPSPEKKAVERLPDTWIAYDVITREVEEMLNRTAERQGSPWIKFSQSRTGQPLNRVKKVQCVCYGDWVHWYWYPDTVPDEWVPLTSINARLAQLLTQLDGGAHILTSLVLNKYRDETDNIIPHHDKTGDLEPGSSIVTLSTGPLAREVLFIHQETGEEVKLTVPPRSVYSIGWETNQKWKHAVPPMKGVTGERYGWTFRSVVSLWNRVTHALVQRPHIGDYMGVWDVLRPIANPSRPELLQSYKVVQTVRLAEPGRLQPSDLEQITDEAEAAYNGSTVRKASNPKHRKPEEKKPSTEKDTKKKRKRDEQQGKENKSKPVVDVGTEKKNKVDSAKSP